MTRRKRSRRKLVVALVVLAVLSGGGVFLWQRALANEAAKPAGEVHRVERGKVVETAAASGTISPHVQVEVKSRGAGEVVEVLVAEGDTVTSGQLLVRLDPADAQRSVDNANNALRGAQAQLAEMRATLQVAELELDDAKTTSALSSRGVELGVVAADQARQATQSEKIAAATVAQRRAQIASMATQIQTAKLSVDDAELRLRETRIFAPIDGTVLSVAVEKGTIVSSAITNVSGGTAVLTVADLADLRVVGAIDEAQIGRVKPGQEVVIRVDAYPDESFRGRVERVSPLGVESTSGVVNFDVEIVISDARKDLLRSGMSADLEIVTSETEGVMVPLTAIESKGQARFVTMADGAKRKIRTGATDGVRIAVLEGLDEGEQILIGASAATTRSERGSGGPFPMGGRGRR